MSTNSGEEQRDEVTPAPEVTLSARNAAWPWRRSSVLYDTTRASGSIEDAGARSARPQALPSAAVIRATPLRGALSDHANASADTLRVDRGSALMAAKAGALVLTPGANRAASQLPASMGSSHARLTGDASSLTAAPVNVTLSCAPLNTVKSTASTTSELLEFAWAAATRASAASAAVTLTNVSSRGATTAERSRETHGKSAVRLREPHAVMDTQACTSATDDSGSLTLPSARRRSRQEPPKAGACTTAPDTAGGESSTRNASDAFTAELPTSSVAEIQRRYATAGAS